jgi:hypothetical protein
MKPPSSIARRRRIRPGPPRAGRGRRPLVAAGTAAASPAVMVFLALMLNPDISRWVNIVLGVSYAVTILLSTIGEDYVYYFVLSFLEGAIAVLIVWYAWKWPEQPVGSAS